MDNGVFLVRFKTQKDKEELLNSGYYLFDNKPVIVKPWTPEAELVKGSVDIVPVWVKLYGIPLKFWGDCLPKIAGLGGNYVKRDDATKDRVRLGFARVMVELEFDKQLKEQVYFLDETGKRVTVNVDYEWRPVSCTLCDGVGHESAV
ncbi:uncharacterized protein LOC141620121 [Silene latifolia]|uniref:uncharacterized protein LOC141620121 n=1 Tax=Silene latifolia TaxID=37657 RepID=UPI003D77DE49